MATPKEIAEATLLVIRRIILWIFLAVLAVCLLYGILIILPDWWKEKNHTDNKDKVIVTIVADKEGHCKPETPYMYTIKNTSKKTVEEIQFYPVVKNKGHSTELQNSRKIIDDKILKPGEVQEMCFSPWNNYFDRYDYARELDFSIKWKLVIFADD